MIAPRAARTGTTRGSCPCSMRRRRRAPCCSTTRSRRTTSWSSAWRATGCPTAWQPGGHRRGRHRRRRPHPRRRARRLPGPQGVYRSRRRSRVLRDGPHRPCVAGAARGAADHPRAAERLSAAALLRHRGGQRGGPRFLLDRVGADSVVLGSDWPFVPWYPSVVTWVEGLASLSRDEKDQILWHNLFEALLKL